MYLNYTKINIYNMYKINIFISLIPSRKEKGIRQFDKFSQIIK